VEIAISPGAVWFAARSLREYGTSYREASRRTQDQPARRAIMVLRTSWN
jgi:hypothetical protein